MATSVHPVYAAIGQDGFTRLVADFYARVAHDPILRPLYPGKDLSGAQERLTLFLIQYWGGPTTYSDNRGHPRLRMRHNPFAIGPAERDAWIAQMRAALDTLQLDKTIDQELWDYLYRAAMGLQNREDPRVAPPGRDLQQLDKAPTGQEPGSPDRI